MLKLLKKADIFDHKFQFNINGNRSVSTLEGGVISIIYFILGGIVFIFNMILTYSSDTPFFSNQVLLRNISKWESVRNSAYDFGFGVYKADYVNYNVELLVPIEPNDYFKNIQVFSSNYTYIPSFSFKKSSAGSVSYCNTTIDLKQPNILMNALCYNFTNSSYIQGGTIMSSGFEYYLESKINSSVCEFINIKDYFKLIASNIKTPDQQRQECRESLSNSDQYQGALTIGFKFSSELLDINSELGYQTVILTKYLDLDYAFNNLEVTVLLSKNTIFTDQNKIYNFLPQLSNVFYSKSISFLTLPKSGDVNFSMRVKFVLDEFETITNRSYNKLDNVLANILSVNQLIYILLKMIMATISYNSLENEIIRSLYYEDSSECPIKKLIFKRNSALPLIRKSLMHNKISKQAIK